MHFKVGAMCLDLAPSFVILFYDPGLLPHRRWLECWSGWHHYHKTLHLQWGASDMCLTWCILLSILLLFIAGPDLCTAKQLLHSANYAMENYIYYMYNVLKLTVLMIKCSLSQVPPPSVHRGKVDNAIFIIAAVQHFFQNKMCITYIKKCKVPVQCCMPCTWKKSVSILM